MNYETIGQINHANDLTPWQKDIEKTILIHWSSLNYNQDEVYRQFATLVKAMEERQRYAGDHYTKHLIDKANALILKINDVNP